MVSIKKNSIFALENLTLIGLSALNTIYKVIKSNSILIFVLICATSLKAQVLNTSPFSRYGIGNEYYSVIALFWLGEYYFSYV